MENFKNYLIRGSDQLGVEVDISQARMMEIYSQHLLLWNKKMNLTAIKDPLLVAEKHFIDSIVTTLFMDNEATLIDLGSGGGFPGIPLKIMKPDLKVVLVDASRKKVNFLKHIIRTLQLNQIQAIHARAEELHQDPVFEGKFDCVISRAFTELSGFISIADPLIDRKGKIYAMKGRQALNEITSSINTNFHLDIHHYQLPFEKSDRCIIKCIHRV